MAVAAAGACSGGEGGAEEGVGGCAIWPAAVQGLSDTAIRARARAHTHTHTHTKHRVADGAGPLRGREVRRGVDGGVERHAVQQPCPPKEWSKSGQNERSKGRKRVVE